MLVNIERVHFKKTVTASVTINWDTFEGRLLVTAFTQVGNLILFLLMI